jgi:hypothetical protein
MNAEQREEVRTLLIAGKKVRRSMLIKYFERRHTDPMVQWQWEALTVVGPISDSNRTGVIYFPNGSRREFDRVTIHE